MSRILLINPPFYRLMGSHYNGLLLGLCYMASVLKNQGYQVMIYNADFEVRTNYLNQRELFENYKIYKRLLNNLNSSIWEEIEEQIRKYAPDIVGISMHTGTYKSAKNIARIIKDISTEIIVVVGGPHPSLDPEGTILNDDNIDFAVRGEGEYTLLELVQGKNKENIPGLSYKKENVVIHNPDRPFIDNLDLLPFPDRTAIINADNHDLASIITGRGCSFICTYCASPRLWKRQVRFRSIDNVLQELEEIHEIIGQQILYFVDDTFSLDAERTKELCRKMIKKGIKVKWKCDTRIDVMDTELIELMKDAGCIRIKVGIESGSEKILKKIKKGVDKVKIRQGVELIKDAGIPITVYLMAGFPGETREDLYETIRFAEELDVNYYSLSIFSPYYGTEIYEDLKKSGIKLNGNHWEYFFHQSGDMIINDHLDKAILDEFLALNEKPNKGVRI